jgi:hypothetical protein
MMDMLKMESHISFIMEKFYLKLLVLAAAVVAEAEAPLTMLL